MFEVIIMTEVMMPVERFSITYVIESLNRYRIIDTFSSELELNENNIGLIENIFINSKENITINSKTELAYVPELIKEFDSAQKLLVHFNNCYSDNQNDLVIEKIVNIKKELSTLYEEYSLEENLKKNNVKSRLALANLSEGIKRKKIRNSQICKYLFNELNQWEIAKFINLESLFDNISESDPQYSDLIENNYDIDEDIYWSSQEEDF